MAYISRRSVLRGSAAIGFGSATGLLGAMTTHAADTTGGYKALVCLFLRGGMDSADTLLPTDEASHTSLAGWRDGLFKGYGVGSGNSSRDRENLLGLQSARDFGGRTFGLPKEMAGMHELYTSGNMAVMGNVGPLVQPTTRTQMTQKSADLPKRLFSHNDQQSNWVSMGLEGERLGWGGQFADRVAPKSGTAKTFASITTDRPDPFLNADQTRQFAARQEGSVKISTVVDAYRLGNNSDEARRLLDLHLRSAAYASDNMLMRDLARGNERTLSDNKLFDQAIEQAREYTTVFPDTKIGKRLATVATAIAVRGVLAPNRQIFFVDSGIGFDTHQNQTTAMPPRQKDVSEAVKAFNDAMIEINVSDKVTLFTASDFGRTLVGNGSGTDHGWGGHHFVVGGAVQGGEFYGDMPSMYIGGEDYTNSRGRMIPGTSVDQYAASLGKWFGLDGAELRDALPNLGNFDSVPDLFGLGATV